MLSTVCTEAMAPTKHPSAWKLNKAEQNSVEQDLATWEANLATDISDEEKIRLKDDERKRLVRLVQQSKHDASLQKQSAAGAKNKAKAAKANAKDAAKPGAGSGARSSGAAFPAPVDTSACNGDYYEQVKQDLAVISKILGNDLKEILPTPIAATVHDKTGIQDLSFNKMIKLQFVFWRPMTAGQLRLAEGEGCIGGTWNLHFQLQPLLAGHVEKSGSWRPFVA